MPLFSSPPCRSITPCVQRGVVHVGKRVFDLTYVRHRLRDAWFVRTFVSLVLSSRPSVKPVVLSFGDRYRLGRFCPYRPEGVVSGAVFYCWSMGSRSVSLVGKA